MTNPSRGELVPGGLAIIIGARRRPDHIGRVVQLVELLEVGQSSHWRCPVSGISHRNVDDEPLWLITGNVKGLHASGSDFAGSGALIAPRCLRPINPEPDPLEITQHQEQSA